tara:strand:- start:23 stop:250 length:228 start_codon:yes stop_codon:yes gene_type:complete
MGLTDTIGIYERTTEVSAVARSALGIDTVAVTFIWAPISMKIPDGSMAMSAGLIISLAGRLFGVKLVGEFMMAES